MLILEWNERAFTAKVNSRCFCWFPAAILVHQNGTPIWRLHTKLYTGAWNFSANNSETVGHKDLRLGWIIYILVFYNISFFCLLPLDGFQFIFLLRDSKKTIYKDLYGKQFKRDWVAKVVFLIHILLIFGRLFTVPYFPVRSSRSSAIRYGLPS